MSNLSFVLSRLKLKYPSKDTGLCWKANEVSAEPRVALVFLKLIAYSPRLGLTTESLVSLALLFAVQPEGGFAEVVQFSKSPLGMSIWAMSPVLITVAIRRESNPFV